MSTHAHSHDGHSHGDGDHSHPHVEVLPEASGTGTVLVDIGDDVGAAAVYVSESLNGVELEIRRVGDEWAGIHVAVRERPLTDGTTWAALFPELSEGDYEIRVKYDPTSATGTLTVIGGRVASANYDRGQSTSRAAAQSARSV